MMIYVGIDPGLDGGIAFLGEDMRVKVQDMPTLTAGTKNRRVLDIRTLVTILKPLQKRSVIVGYEAQVAMPRQSSQSTAKIFQQFGAIEGILAALDLPHMTPIRSTTWKKVVLRDMPTTSKDSAILYVQQRFPKVELIPEGCRVPRDGRADAICIAEYVRMQNYKDRR